MVQPAIAYFERLTRTEIRKWHLFFELVQFKFKENFSKHLE